jgi:hypothetical protein
MVVAIRVFTIALLLGAFPFAAFAAALPSPNPVAAPPQKAGHFSVVIDRVAPPTQPALGNDVQTCYQYYDSNGRDCVNDFAAGDLGIAFSWQQCSEADCVTSTGSYAVYKAPEAAALFFRLGEGPPIAPPLPADHKLVASGKFNGQVGMAVIPAAGFTVGDCFTVRVFAGSSPTGAHSMDSPTSCVTSQTRIGAASTTLYPAAEQGGKASSTCGASPSNTSNGVGYTAFSPTSQCPDLGTDWTKTWSVGYWVYVDFKIPTGMYILDATLKAAGDVSCAHELDAVHDNWEYGDQNPLVSATRKLNEAKLNVSITSWLAGGQGSDISLKIGPSDQAPGSSCMSYPGAISLDVKVLK